MRPPAARRAGSVSAAEGVPSALGARRPVWVLLSLVVPFLGVLLGLLLYDHPEEGARRTGKAALWAGFLAWMVAPFLVISGLLAFAATLVLAVLARVLPPAY